MAVTEVKKGHYYRWILPVYGEQRQPCGIFVCQNMVPFTDGQKRKALSIIGEQDKSAAVEFEGIEGGHWRWDLSCLEEVFPVQETTSEPIPGHWYKVDSNEVNVGSLVGQYLGIQDNVYFLFAFPHWSKGHDGLIRSLEGSQSCYWLLKELCTEDKAYIRYDTPEWCRLQGKPYQEHLETSSMDEGQQNAVIQMQQAATIQMQQVFTEQVKHIVDSYFFQKKESFVSEGERLGALLDSIKEEL